MPKFEVPDGWTVQAFRFTLDPTEDQAKALARHFGARRKAYNWTVATLKADIQAWHASGTVTAKPSLRVLRKRWNTVKDDVCVNTETGVAWWPECSKEAYADGIAGAVEAYWNWQTSRAGKRAGKRVGFPRFKRKGRDQDRVSFTTGAMRVEPDRRHLTLPVIGTVRTHENTRRIERLIKAGRARVLAISVRRNGTRLDASVRVLVQRPQQPKVVHPGSRVGVDVGVRRLATVATADGTAIEQVENPRPLGAALRELRHVCRARSRCTKGSRRYRERTTQISRLPGQRCPHPSPARPDDTVGSNPRPHCCRRLGRDRDVAAKRVAGCPRSSARTVGCGPGHSASALVLQDSLVRVGAGGRRPLVPVVENLPRLPACARHRLGRTMAMRPMLSGPSA
ncbi:transposase [Mycobacterium tuberculosis TKK_04_0159]|nr:transposase [Mycobacterium tuberculosis TKK_04_0159]KBW04644.1 transposase [Mycobacterium tuberculosis TKK_02_0010]KBW23467.1 transposase [Mycobacterium tuberculosis TKK_02_0011]KBY08964.1 transposase [Mycobacterium tuberculosis TKK-01-0005]KBZ77348.1 transposase [Mycobacterium tuberculosis TKK-01-0055]KBZ80065.1 transposase [Mycobacterium tuberculosis TKK-01-0056]KCL86325.1 transposase [Mycobacterium tuberculosis TB_RSA177]KCL92793.1 transposase [Mycobacterium tuberculosis TB_RSA178]